jgi:hypothetical protein
VSTALRRPKAARLIASAMTFGFCWALSMSSTWKLKYFCWSMRSVAWASVSVSTAAMSVFLV